MTDPRQENAASGSHDSHGRVAALYVDPNGVYAGLPDVDVWDEQREPPHTHVVGAGIHSGESTWAPRDNASMRTPEAFRDVLLAMARTASVRAAA